MPLIEIFAFSASGFVNNAESCRGMPSLIGVTGYSGAGKTTAIEHLVATCGASRIYVGQLIADEVARLGMPCGPDSEKTVRKELRDRDGMEALAVLVEPAVRKNLESGRPVMIDAICCLQEIDYYRKTFDQNAPLISVVTSFEARVSRAQVRREKPMTREQLMERDELENTFLETNLAIEAAIIKVSNEGSLDDLHRQLDDRVRYLVT
jgi:dephospho-CoA kinase